MSTWQDLRECTDDALKALALLPGAGEAGDDSEVLERLSKLSAALRQVDHFVDTLGDHLNAEASEEYPSDVRRALNMIDGCVVALLADDGSDGPGFRQQNLKVITQQTNNIRGWVQT